MTPLKIAELRTTADKKEIKDFRKLPSATSFIRKTISEITDHWQPDFVWEIKYEMQ